MNNLYPVYTLQNECHDCYKCVRECHSKAIKIENGHASVISSKCIACGSCVKACPAGAKRLRYDIEKVKNLFRAQKQVFVSLAPTWRGVYDFSSERMITILKALGFSEVSETALGAQEVSLKTAEMLNNSDKGLHISSACPVVVDYIRLYMSEFTKNITPVASPALTHAKMLKEQYGENIAVVFIGPCIAKKNEADKHPELIDAALTFEELKFWIEDSYLDLPKLKKDKTNKFVPETAYEGSLYPVEGGMNETIKKIGVSDNIQLLNISSLPAIEKALNGLDVTKLKNTVFIEALGCDGGCTAGPCISTTKAGLLVVSNILNTTKHRDEIPKTPQIVCELDYQESPVVEKNSPLNEILAAMKKIGKHKEEDELNCGGCGYPTCRDLAQALIKKEAEPSMCVSYMRKIAMRKAAAMLRSMPSAVVMFDNELKIVEANNAFMKMFCGEMYDIFVARPDGLVGASLDRIIDFSHVLRPALKTGKDIHKERFPIKNRLYDITAFVIEENELVGAVITDVTQSELTREKIATRAQEVITKNIAIVQDIACLLGEHMVETELLLSSIADNFESDKDEE